MHERDIVHKLACTYNDSNLMSKYRKLRNQVTSAIQNAKRTFFHSEIKHASGNQRRMWQVIRLATNKQSSSPNSDITATSFNEHFVSIGIKLASKFN